MRAAFRTSCRVPEVATKPSASPRWTHICFCRTAFTLRCPRVAVRTASTRIPPCRHPRTTRSEEHTSELQSRPHLVCRLLLEKKKTQDDTDSSCISSALTMITKVHSYQL